MSKQVQTTDKMKKLIERTLSKTKPELEYLYGRWQDEKEYEDINDYGDRLAKLMPEEFTYVTMTKRPFAFHFNIGDQTGYYFFVDARSVGWKRRIKNHVKVKV